MNLEEILKAKSPKLFKHFESIKTQSSEYLDKIDSLISLYDHSSIHSKKIIDILDAMLQPIKDSDEFLNDHELFILLVVAYMHDIGITQTNKNLPYSKSVKYEYDQNLIKHAQYIHDKILKIDSQLTKQFKISLPEINEDYKTIVAKVAKGHSREFFSEIIDSFEKPVMINGNKVRVRLLTSLFIIADKLDLRNDRVYLNNVNRYILPDYSQLVWYKFHLIDKITITNCKIKTTLSYHCVDIKYNDLIKSFLHKKLRGLINLGNPYISEATSGKLKFTLMDFDINVDQTNSKRCLPAGALRCLENVYQQTG